MYIGFWTNFHYIDSALGVKTDNHITESIMDKYWPRIRNLGKTKFIIIYAILLGLFMSLFSTLVSMLIDYDFDSSRFISSSAFGMFIGGFLGGLLSGVAQWYHFKNKDKRLKN